MALKKSTTSKVRKSWHTQLAKIFPVAYPASAEWTALEDIRQVLDVLADEEGITTVLAPWKGGTSDCLLAVRLENGLLELVGEEAIFALRPARLEFDSFPEAPSATYFRLLTSDHPAKDVVAASTKKAQWGSKTLRRYEAQAGGFALFPARTPYLQSKHQYKDHQSSKTRSKFRELMKNPRPAKFSDSESI